MFSVLKAPLAYTPSLPSQRKNRSQAVHFMFPTRVGAGATQETPEELHCQDDEHQESVEKHRSVMCELVSVLWLPLNTSFAN